MHKKTHYALAATFAACSVVCSPLAVLARDTVLTGGLSVGFDYSDRQYETVIDDPQTPDLDESLQQRNDDEEDYQRVFLSPLLQIISRSPVDTYEFRAKPKIKYDLDDEDTDWDSDFFLSAERYLTRYWILRASNYLLRSDYYEDSISPTTEDGGEAPPVASSGQPELSPDTGRTRYWRNTFDLSSDYIYREDSLIRGGFSYIILDNDDDARRRNVEDYDRYSLSLRNEHRYTSIWKSIVELEFVRGDFDEINRDLAENAVDAVAPDADLVLADSDLSRDVKEYYLTAAIENYQFSQSVYSLTYNYIGTKYDEFLRDDGDIHQARIVWQKEYSSRLMTTLGAGPSYEKTEGRDANWGGNGIAEVDYRYRRGSLKLTVEKNYGVDNFSGTDERGFIDAWLATFKADYQVSKDFSLYGRLSYLYEDREDTAEALGRAIVAGETVDTITDVDDLIEIHKDRVVAGGGISYDFWRDYTASLDYTYTNQDSDLLRDDYDEHRLLLTLSWQSDLLRW